MLELVVPDCGPLIGLALLDRLDLLDRFQCAIVITDMVRYELERGGEEAADRPIVEHWLSQPSNRIQCVETTYGLMYKALPADLQKQIRLRRNAGENSIREFLDEVESSLPLDGEALVLFEDEAVLKMSLGERVHKIHTYAFLRTMENMGHVASADDLIRELKGKRRNLARVLYERRVPGDGDSVDWTLSIDQEPTPGM